MSELRELLRNAEDVSISLYAFLEALMTELEAQRPPEVDARIAKLTADCDSWERQCRNAERGLADVREERRLLRCGVQDVRCGLAEAKAELQMLRSNPDAVEGLRLQSSRDSWRKRCREAERVVDMLHRNHQRELAEAKAEIERLRKERDSAEHKLEALGTIDETILADAEIGRLVRGMRLWSRLSRGCASDDFFVAMAEPPNDWRTFPGNYADPAEALRSIQAKEEQE